MRKKSTSAPPPPPPLPPKRRQGVPAAAAVGDGGEIDSIFSAIKASVSANSVGTRSASREGAPAAPKRARATGESPHGVSASMRETRKRRTEPVSSGPSDVKITRPRDGLYREKESNVDMSDATFFNVDGSRKADGKRHKTRRAYSEQDLKNEGVDRIVTEEEILRLATHNSRGGTTPNCPFDCDCCF